MLSDVPNFQYLKHVAFYTEFLLLFSPLFPFVTTDPRPHTYHPQLAPSGVAIAVHSPYLHSNDRRHLAAAIACIIHLQLHQIECTLP
eukprot:jgi/Psemu1/27446/gm1.27446_g